jgi:uncharacterized protein YraI
METNGKRTAVAKGCSEHATAQFEGVSNARMDRRQLLRLVGGIGAAGVAAGIWAKLPAGVSAASGFRVTSALNLRSEPSTQSKVILVMPASTIVKSLGQTSNGFAYVDYQGTSGWAYSSYLEGADGGGGGDLPPYRGESFTTSTVNLRSGPGTNYGAILVIPADANVDVYDEYANDFWLVRYQGQFGYVHSNFLTSSGSSPANYLMTTTALNLRDQPSTAGQILKVIPAGAQVVADSAISNGYRAITYGQISGWVLAAGLQ